jgi:hypothetical protein
MQGSEGFTDVTRQSGIFSSQIGYGLQVSIGDLSEDGYPDVYISNDFHENDYLYINNGDGSFSDQFSDRMTYSSRSSMGNDIADMNNDGLLDVIVLDMLPEKEEIRQRAGGEDDFELFEIKRRYGYHYQFVRNTLQLNLGGGRFSEIGRLAGIYATDWSWAPLWCDLDNDGWKDLFVSNGIFRRANDLDYIRFLIEGGTDRLEDPSLPDKILYEKMPLEPLVNYTFRNNRDLTFTDMSSSWGINWASFSNGAAYADLDNDGDLDLVVNNINDYPFIYRNQNERINNKNFLRIRFAGKKANTKGIGVRTELFMEGSLQIMENYTSRGFFSSVPPELHFGLDTLAIVDSVRIHWPGGKIQKLYDIPANQFILADEEDASFEKSITNHLVEDPIFSKVGYIEGLDFRHRENEYNDFLNERLMPHNLSRVGPCIAVGDVNSDGRQDVYMGAAHDQAPGLYLQTEEGSFNHSQLEFFRMQAFYEDVDAEFFDPDQDGDLDLYVVSGGSRYRIPHPLMEDRLYLNDGSGRFSLAAESLPGISHNGSCLAAGDVDSDGDTDLFIGSRSIPGAYGLFPQSWLLINNGNGIFLDQTQTRAPDLARLGMVTDAVWTDVDGDMDPDLLICGEWMPLALFINQNGILEKSIIDKTGGWWFSITTEDMDADGDQDFIAGNLGLNSYLKASGQAPLKMIINDFDENGMLDQIITIHKNGKDFLFESADELFRQLPSLESEFTGYSDFAGKAITEILPGNLIEQSIILEINCLESSYFENEGNGNFKRISLPAELQFSPVFSLLPGDFNLDGITDLLTGGNLYSVKPAYGRYGDSYGWYLEGSANGHFNVLKPIESGFEVEGEIRSIKKLKVNRNELIIVGVNDNKPELFLLDDQ